MINEENRSARLASVEDFLGKIHSEDMQYMTIRDLQRFLVPSINSLPLENREDFILGIYTGNSSEASGYLLIKVEGKNLTLVLEEDDTIYSIYQSSNRQSSKKYIFEYLRNLGLNPSEVTYSVFKKDEIIEAGDVAIEVLNEGIGKQEPEPKKIKPTKKKRQPPRRKKTRAQEKEAERRRLDNELREIFQAIDDFCAEKSDIIAHIMNLWLIIEKTFRYDLDQSVISKISSDKVKYGEFIRTLWKVVHEFDEHNLRKAYIGDTPANKLRNKAESLFLKIETGNPFRTNTAEHFGTQNSSRDYSGYLHILKFEPDTPIIKNGSGTVVDIGSGNAHSIANSFLNTVSEFTNIKAIGIEPSIDPTKAAVGDISAERIAPYSEGRVKILPEFAQNMSIPDQSVDLCVSVWAFDKFNDAFEGTAQALREVARILKPDGEARIFAIQLDNIETKRVLNEYFEHMIDPEPIEGKSYTLKRQQLNFIHVKKRRLTADQEQALEKESKDWKAKFVPNNIIQ
jgi:SAM-dependent methyltransferase